MHRRKVPEGRTANRFNGTVFKEVTIILDFLKNHCAKQLSMLCKVDLNCHLLVVQALKFQPAVIEPLSINAMEIQSWLCTSQRISGRYVLQLLLHGSTTYGQSYFGHVRKTGPGSRAEQKKRIIVTV